MKTVFLRTAPGMEDLVQKETLGLIQNMDPSTGPLKGRSGKGWVELESPVTVVPEELFSQIRTVFRGLQVHASAARGDDDPAQVALTCTKKGGFRELKSRPPFRITCYAPDESSGTRRRVEQAAGDAAVRASSAPVSLTEYTVNYGIEFIENRVFFGPVFKDEDETPRYRKLFQVRSSLKAHIAAGMLQLVGYTAKPGVLLDPCCGSGTILLEAAAVHPGTRLYGVDVDPRCAEGAQRNITALSSADGGSRVYQGDARKLEELFSAGSISYITMNPPFGIRTGKRINFYWFYRELLRGADRLLTGKGKIAILIGRQRGIFNRAVQEDGNFRLLHVRVINASGLFPALYILGRRA